MNVSSKRPSGGRLYPRPESVRPCPACGAPAGRNYVCCQACHDIIENLWITDWNAFLGNEQISPGSEDEKLLAQVVVDGLNQYPWTIVDSAMKLVHCKTCGNELGGGPLDCLECSFAFGNLWGYDAEAMHQGQMTGNEHALRVGRWVIRYPHRQSRNVVESWKFSMPIMITGQMATTEMGQFFRKVIEENSFDLSRKIYQSFEEAYWDVARTTAK